MDKMMFTSLSTDDLKSLFKETLKEELALYFSAEGKVRPNYDMLTMKELCSQLQVSKPTVIAWCRKGILKGHKVGRKVFFKKEEIEKSLKDYRGSNAQEMRLLSAYNNYTGGLAKW